MWPLTLIALALVAGFFLGHGAALPLDLVPLLVAIVLGFLVFKAAEQHYEH
jgi:hypothetical protein